MNEFESAHLPEAYRPLSPWAVMGLTALYLVPAVGWAFMILFAVSGKNVNRRNHARGMLLTYALAAIVAAAVWLVCYITKKPVLL